MKKCKKNKIFAIAIISAILCGLFCITAFAWDSSWTVEPFVEPETVPAGYTLITITDSSSTLGSQDLENVSVYFPRASSYLYGNGFRCRPTSGLAVYIEGDPVNVVSTSGFVVSNGGCVYVENSKVADVLSYLDNMGITATAPDPVQDIFDNVSQGVTGALNIATSTASLLTTNTVLTIMCVALPLVSFGVGLLIRLKERS